MPAVYEFRFSEEFLIAAFRRFWRYRRNRTFSAIRLVTAAFAGAFAVLFIVIGMWWLGLFFALLIVGAFQGRKLDEWFIRRRFRKSPYHDDSVRTEVSDGGLWISGTRSETRLTWEAFTRAVRSPDGWLLFQGPGVLNWLPDSAFRQGESTERLDDLVERHAAGLEVSGAGGSGARSGFPTFEIPAVAPPITPERVRESLDEE